MLELLEFIDELRYVAQNYKIFKTFTYILFIAIIIFVILLRIRVKNLEERIEKIEEKNSDDSARNYLERL